MSFLEENGVDLKDIEVHYFQLAESENSPLLLNVRWFHLMSLLLHMQVRSSIKEEDYENPVPNIIASNPQELALPPNMVEEDKTSRPSSQTEADEANNVRAEQARPMYERTLSGGLQSPRDAGVSKEAILERVNSKSKSKSYQLGHRLSLNWSTGNGPRIGCVKDYPMELRMQALEMVQLSPRASTPPASWRVPSCLSPTLPTPPLVPVQTSLPQPS
jgi:hypothetical protein